MEHKPKYRIEQTTTDWLLEISGWAALAFIWIITLFYFRKLPDTIPTHFTISGKADDFGSRWTIFLSPAIGTVLFTGMTILNKYPHIFNYPVKITPENMLRHYTMATRLVRVLKLSVVIIFIIIAWTSCIAAIDQTNKLVFWFMPMILVIVFVPLGYYIYKSFNNK